MLVWAGRLCVCGLLAGAARGVRVVGALGPSGLLSPLLGSKKKSKHDRLTTQNGMYIVDINQSTHHIA